MSDLLTTEIRKAGSRFLGVILAAGNGSRMAVLSEALPKSLLPVLNKPLIQHQLELMRELGIIEVVIVTGAHGSKIQNLLGKIDLNGLNIKYVEQRERLGIAHALSCIEHLVQGPMLVFLGDIFFVPVGMGSIFEQFLLQAGGAILVAKEEKNPLLISKNFGMLLGPHGNVVNVVEKPREVSNNLKGVGIYVFDTSVFDAIRRTPKSALRNEYEITHTVQVLIDSGLPVSASLCIKLDININTPEDLLYLNLSQSRGCNKSLRPLNLDAVEGVHINGSIVGDGVRVIYPIKIRNSLIFNNTVVKTKYDLVNSIVLQDRIIKCKNAI